MGSRQTKLRRLTATRSAGPTHTANIWPNRKSAPLADRESLRHADCAMFVVGILRGGGDIRFSALLDVGALWLASVPAVAITVLVFHLPVHWVYAAMLLENLVKAVGGMIRFLSKRWIKNIIVKEAAGEAGFQAT